MTIEIEVATRPAEKTTVVAIVGDIDLQTSAQLESVLSGLHGNVVIDLTDTAFLDSTGLGLFVGLDNRLRPDGYSISFVCPNPNLQKIFRITRLDALWPIRAE